MTEEQDEQRKKRERDYKREYRLRTMTEQRKKKARDYKREYNKRPYANLARKAYDRGRDPKRNKLPQRIAWVALWHKQRMYGLNLEKFTKLWNDQKGLCLGCDIKLVSTVFFEEKKQYDDDPNLIENVDYAIAWVDHDHSFDVDGKPSGNSDSVRGLLCPYCNHKTVDPLNPKSRLYIYGVDGDLNKKEIIMNRDFLKQVSEKGELK